MRNILWNQQIYTERKIIIRQVVVRRISLYRIIYPVIFEKQVTDHEFELVSKLFTICIQPSLK